MKKCDICGKENTIIQYVNNGKKFCNNCYRKIKQEKCSECEKIKRVDKRIDGKPLCPNCARKHCPKSKCSKCKKIKTIHHRSKQLCHNCCRKAKQEKCSECEKIKRVDKRIDGKPLCPNCSKKYISKCKCSKCGEIKLIHYRKENLCHNCYRKEKFRIKQKCSKCGEIRKKETKEGLCNRCYKKTLERKCSICGIKRRIETKDGKCMVCYVKDKMKTDIQFRIKRLTRQRIRQSLSSRYSAKYDEIITSLGPCPGKLEDYHIDHIFPLSAFDLEKEKDIAFAPENHQWLLSKENLKKGAKYDKEELKEFKRNIINKYKLGQ